MSDQYTPPKPIPSPMRPTISGASTDPHRSDYRAEGPTVTPAKTGGFSTGILIAIVFVVIAVMAAVLLGNRDMGGTDDSLIPVGGMSSGDPGTPVQPTGDPVAPAPEPAPAPAPTEVPANPVTPPAQAPTANP